MIRLFGLSGFAWPQQGRPPSRTPVEGVGTLAGFEFDDPAAIVSDSAAATATPIFHSLRYFGGSARTFRIPIGHLGGQLDGSHIYERSLARELAT
jgi:hypothetical protein